MSALKTYDLVITNLSTNESVTIYGSKRGLFHWVPPMKGFGNPDVRTSSYVYSGNDGGYISEQFHGMRQIPITATLHSKDYDEFAEMAALIARVLRIRDDLRVQLFTPSGKVYSLTARLTQPLDPNVEYPLLADYDIELLAADPLIYDYTAGSALEVTLQRPSMGGLLWDADGLRWANNGLLWLPSGAGVTVVNGGSVDVWPIVEITGAAINPSVTNETLDQTVSLEITTAATDVIRIDMYNKEVTLRNVNDPPEDGVNIFNNLDLNQFWRLIPGNNEVVFDSEGGSDTATAKLTWFNGYLGVL